MRYIMALTFIFLLGNSATCLGYTLIATEDSNGVYAEGELETGEGEFILKYEVDEEKQTITRTEVINIKSKEVFEDNTVYYITVNSTDLSGEHRITAVGKPGTAATEIIHFGKDTFLNCKVVYGYAAFSQGHYVVQQ